ncbi:condensation domain-containing protein [Gordonia sp. (in: high G+C Gram-positive bacteria)]|uniref:condensation domain-containing protein n=1 Tax=Gordonia sp. (in: high G+C Gram-positive bacteria) TaxID=84139 RepID=UPI003F9C0034
MTIDQLTRRIADAGIQLWAQDGRLRYRAPRGTLTDDLRAELVAHRNTLLADLTRTADLAENTDGDFPLTEIQAGYLVGRTTAFADGGVGCQGYHQFDIDTAAAGIPPARRAQTVAAAWDRLVALHPMLRVRVDPDRFAQRVDESLALPLQVTDYADEQQARTANDRLADRLVRHVYDPAQQRPLVDAALVLGPESAVLHLSVDLIVTDYVGIRTLVDDLDRILAGETVEPPAATFQQYLAADAARQGTPEFAAAERRAEEYWDRRVPQLAPPLRFPAATTAGTASFPPANGSGYSRRSHTLTTAEWAGLCAVAAHYEATPAAVLLADFADVAAAYGSPRATIMMTSVDRRPIVPDADRIVGDFTSTVVVELAAGGDRATAIRAVRDDVFAGLEHSAVSGMRVARQLAGDAREQTAMPVVFTYTVAATGTPAPRLLRPRPGTGRSRTPQVLLDVQVTPLPNGVSLDWDSRDDGFAPDVLDAAFADFVERVRSTAASKDTGPAVGEPAAAADPVATALASAHTRLSPRSAAAAHMATDSERVVREVMAWHLQRAGMHRPVTVDEVARRLGATDREALVGRWIQELAEAGLVRIGSSGASLTRPVQPVDESLSQWAHIRRRAAEIDYGDAQLAYVEDCLRSLGGLLDGSVDPLTLLFPDGDFDVARAAYDDNLVARYLNGLCAAAIRAVADGHDRPLRVLEIGGGVGGTTRPILDALAGCDVDYLFTDVSHAFLRAARDRWPQLTTELFDVDDDPSALGRRFDVIVCANVLHNASDIPATIRRLTEALTPGGSLAIIDSTAPSAALMATMEFKEGLTDHRDLRAQTGAPFLRLDQWLDVLGEHRPTVYPPAGHPLETAGQHFFWLTPRDRPDRREQPDDDRIAQVVAIWADVLDAPAESLGPDSDFMAHGGDSLLLARCVGRLRRELDWPEPSAWDRVYRAIVAEPTVRGCMAALLPGASNTPDTSKLPGPQQVPAAGPLADPAAPITRPGRRDHGDGPVQLTELIAPTAPDAVPMVLIHDGSGGLGPYAELLPELGDAAGGVYGIERSPDDGYLDLPPAQLFDVLERRYARALLERGFTAAHVVGFCMGGLLAAGVAAVLDAHDVVAETTAISSYRIPFEIDDDVLTDYAFAKVLGRDPAEFGIVVDDDAVGATLTAARAAGHRVIDRSIVAEFGPPDLLNALQSAPATTGERLQQALRASPDDGVTEETLHGMRAIFVHSLAAVAQWRQPPLLAPATFLRQQRPMSYLPTLGEDMSAFWRTHCLGEFTVIDVPGDHFTCLNGPNAGGAADLLTASTGRRATADGRSRP